jgi:hypothetical protein
VLTGSSTAGYWHGRNPSRLEDALAEAMLAGTVRAGNTAIVDLDEAGTIVVRAMNPSERVLQSVL